MPVPAGAGVAGGDAYRELRRLQHKARLNEEPTQVEADSVRAERDAVLAVWQHVLGEASGA